MRCALLVAATMTAALCMSSCDDEPIGPDTRCLCTTEFAQVAVTVLDERGWLLSDIRLEITMNRTGHKIDTSLLFHRRQCGEYAIFNDAFISLIDPAFRAMGEEIRVVGFRDVIAFDRIFVIGVPGPCACHVQKYDGPDTIVVQCKDRTF